MKKIITVLTVSGLLFYVSASAQNGRPAKIGDNAPVITPRNSLEKDVAAMGEKLNALDKRISTLETDNAALKTENTSLHKQITDLEGVQKVNYKILENYTTTLKQRFDSQVGTFRITGFISNKSLATSGAVNLLVGSHD